MLFNSLEFALCFLPLVLAGFLILGLLGRDQIACGWLALASLFFYGYWVPEYLFLLLASVAANFLLGEAILKASFRNEQQLAIALLALAIALNLGTLGYFKYANFFLDNLARFGRVQFEIPRVVLPIGISFFTFTQIAYLVDTYQGKVRETNPVHYLLFVTYFPHLIAGPILHHAEMMPQFRNAATYRFSRENFLSGTLVFLVGLFKKVILADGIQPFVAPVFDAPLQQPLTIVEAWGGALAYTLQLYFDFSGYSDMAIGLSRMFNIELPLNFNSPYKAVNIIDFWRRWHMTLSRFLRDYLYIPLGGNRKGDMRRHGNLMATMLLGGLWHGAGWSFIVWGGLHGCFLAINHAWQAFSRKFGLARFMPAMLGRFASWLLTFVCVVVAWVFFRAKDMESAVRILMAMFDLSTFVLPDESLVVAWLSAQLHDVRLGSLAAFGGDRQIAWTLLLLVFAWWWPNTQETVQRLRRAQWLGRVIASGTTAFLMGAMCFWILLMLMINETRGVSEFIYFNF